MGLKIILINNMELKELLGFIEKQDKVLIKHFGSSNLKQRILSRTVKLAEEFGELCNEVLALNGDQRQEKLDNTNKENLSYDFADVIITACLLAKSVDVDIEKALEIKILKIKRRFAEDYPEVDKI